MIKPISVELPYPDITNVVTNKKTARLLGEAYAGRHSELNTILQYVYHYLYFKRLGDNFSAKTVLGIALCEMKHMEILGELLLKLGADPVFYYPTPLFKDCPISSVSFAMTKQKMVFDNVSIEMVEISCYKKILDCVSEQTTREVLKRIILDEELHVKILKDMLNNKHFAN